MTPNTIICKNRREWRSWLEKNHNSVKEIWLVYYKKHTKKPTVYYDEAVEEALCYGWIDSTVRTIDDEKYSQKFTPRNKKSNWSELNKSRVRKLINEGKMTPAGLEKLEGVNLNEACVEKTLVLSSQFEQTLMSNKPAWTYFNSLAPSHRKQYTEWIMSAKREETQIKRLSEAIIMLEKNLKLGMK